MTISLRLTRGLRWATEPSSWSNKNLLFVNPFSVIITARLFLVKVRTKIEKINYNIILRPLESSSLLYCLTSFFSATIRCLVHFLRELRPTPKIIKNHSWTYKSLYCKEEPYRFSGERDPLLQRKKAYYFI